MSTSTPRIGLKWQSYFSSRSSVYCDFSPASESSLLIEFGSGLLSVLERWEVDRSANAPLLPYLLRKTELDTWLQS